MNREYFAGKYRLDNVKGYFLWSCDLEADFDNDQVWTKDGVAPSFKTLQQALNFAQQMSLSPLQTEEPLLHDLDYVDYWLGLKKMKRARQFYPGEILSAWNIFSDLARSVALPFSGNSKQLTPLWEKLLFGDERRRFTRWSGRELSITHEVLSEGLMLWRAHVRKHATFAFITA